MLLLAQKIQCLSTIPAELCLLFPSSISFLIHFPQLAGNFLHIVWWIGVSLDIFLMEARWIISWQIEACYT